MLGIQYEVIIAYLVGMVLLYVLGWLPLAPLKIVLKLVVNGLIGGALLLLINFLGGAIHLQIPLNIINALVAGFLGIPGVVLIVALNWLLV